MSRPGIDMRSIRSRNRPPRSPIPAEVVVASTAAAVGSATEARQSIGNASLASILAAVSTAANQDVISDTLASIEDLLTTIIADSRAARGFEPSEPTLSFLVGAS